MANTKVRARLSESQRGLFSSATSFYGNNNFLKPQYQAMSIGKNIKGTTFVHGKYMELPHTYTGRGRWHTHGTLKTKQKWFASYSSSEVIQLRDLQEMVLQMTISAHQLAISAEHYRFVLAQRALKIFQGSFELKRFNSHGYGKWPAISDWTKKKRMYGGLWPTSGKHAMKRRAKKRKSTWPGAGGLMQETNALYNSMKYIPNMGAFTSGVKALSKYAGVHNNPDSDTTYGNGWGHIFAPPKKAKQRQFMGHSTLMNDFINEYEKRYLFDAVFRSPSGK